MNLTGETKVFLGIILATITIIVVAAFAFARPAQSIPREQLILENTHVRGKKDAAVYLVEFSDFQCPACKNAEPVVEDVLSDYGDRIEFAYRHFPLQSHPYSMQAAIAAEAAGLQGKFFEMGHLLFINQTDLSDTKVASLASELGLDTDKFANDIADPALKAKVENDQADGLRFGINSTPTFFVNGRKITLSSFADIKTEVEKALQ